MMEAHWISQPDPERRSCRGCARKAATIEHLHREINELREQLGHLLDELTGTRAAARSRMRRRVLAGPPGFLLCACGHTMHDHRELDDHLDHLIDAEAENAGRSG